MDRSTSGMGPADPRELEKRLLDVAVRAGSDVDKADRRLRALDKIWGDAAYAGFIRLFTHLDFTGVQARRHWDAAVGHTAALGEALGRKVDFRVGMADYFVHEKHKIRHPKVIDLKLFRETEAGNLRDGLTGLFNFRYLEEALPREMGKARRASEPLSLIFLDVDNFKAYNDRFGHEAGNVVLQGVTEVIRGAVRGMDLACRYGGEEFTVLLPSTDKTGALTVAHRIVRRIEGMAIPAAVPGAVVTASAGVAAVPADTQEEAGLVRSADAAMYHAKAQGKNRAVVFTPERRAHVRRHRRYQGTCTLSDRFALSLSGRDLSQGGLYFFSPHELFRGCNLDLDLDLAEGDERVSVRCSGRVVRSEPGEDGTWGVGAAILTVSPADRLRFFQATASEAHPA